MDSPAFLTQLNAGSRSCFQNSISATETSGQAFSRLVDAVNVGSERTAENYRQMPTGRFHNPFDNPKFAKRSVTVLVKQRENAPLKQSIRAEEQQRNDQAYNPSKERFSIETLLDFGQSTSQSSSGIDQYSLEMTNSSSNNQDRIETISKPVVQVAFTGDNLLTSNMQQYGMTPKGSVNSACEPDSSSTVNPFGIVPAQELGLPTRPGIEPDSNQSLQETDSNDSRSVHQWECFYKRILDSQKRQLKNQREKERYKKIMQDPIKKELKNRRQREYYHKRKHDPIKKIKKELNQRQKERSQDPKSRKLIIASDQNSQSLLTTSRIDALPLTCSFAENTPGFSKNAGYAPITRFSMVKLKEYLPSQSSLSHTE